MLVYYFVLFIVSNRYLLFWVSNGHNSVTVQNRTHVYMNFFHHKVLGNHLLQLCPKVVKHLYTADYRESVKSLLEPSSDIGLGTKSVPFLLCLGYQSTAVPLFQIPQADLSTETYLLFPLSFLPSCILLMLDIACLNDLKGTERQEGHFFL